MEESITYIRYADWNNGELPENGCLLMSAQEFIEGGKNITGVPITITPYGEEPEETEQEF